LPAYEGTLDLADEAFIYLSEHAREIKRMDRIEESVVQTYFKHPKLKVIRDAETLQKTLQSDSWSNSNILMMSSGTFDGVDLPSLGEAQGLSRVQ
jgi:UDP-N-acetylmuramate: L-alanyl-gamma-D-glutamyl-meso-diaminopimelate ligase